MKKKHILCTLLLAAWLAPAISAQPEPKEWLKVERIYKKDAEKYREFVENYGDAKTNYTMIVHADSSWGSYYWTFVKEEKQPGQHDQPSVHNLYADIVLEDHGGTLPIASFKDFGNEVYWPEFLYPYCIVDDADHDGTPEFYLTYFGASDGLDAKPLKVIVYSTEHRIHAKYMKSKVTAYYPAVNEDDRYHVEYDTSWKKLPKPIADRAMELVREVKRKGLVE